jgi:hypothetical protein
MLLYLVSNIICVYTKEFLLVNGGDQNLDMSKVNFRVETKILVSMSEEIK